LTVGVTKKWRPPAARPEFGWSGRSYRTSGSAQAVAAPDGEWGVGIPLRRPGWALELAMWLLFLGMLVVLGVGVRRIVAEGRVGGGQVVGLLACVLFGAFFALAAVSAHRLRTGPARWLLLTPTRVLTPFHAYRWEHIDGVSAESYRGQGDPRRRNLIVLQLVPGSPDPISAALPRVGRWVAERTGDQVKLVAAEDLDVDPWQVIRTLRAVHADPALRARLGSADGPAIVAAQDAGRP